MTFRTRILVGFLVVALLPLLVFAGGTRRLVRQRLVAQYDRRVELSTSMLREDLIRQDAAVAERVASLAAVLAEDNRFRQGIQGIPAARSYVLDYAGGAMRQAALDMLLVLDHDGRVLSSGHFRNEYGRSELGLTAAVENAGAAPIVVAVQTAAGRFDALVGAAKTRLGGRDIWVVGGVDLQRRIIDRWSGDDEVTVTFEPDRVGPRDAQARIADDLQVVREVSVVYLETDSTGLRSRRPARFRITHSLRPLQALAGAVDAWFVVALLVTSLAALGVAAWVSLRLSRPLAVLAQKTAQLDLDSLDVDFTSDRPDEIGALSRLLGSMTARLRASTSRVRDAERRATLGEFARQVNHDIKNGLTPIRNVLHHFSDVVRAAPAQLPDVFLERQGTLDSSLSYLEALASNYSKLSPATAPVPCDVAAIVHRVVAGAQTLGHGSVRADVASSLPHLHTDPMVLQRVLENLVRNALASLGPSGVVTVSAALAPDALPGGAITISVTDTGRGMTQEETRRIFEDFYTTTPGGTGLGLSIVRRLVGDLNGRLHLESEPGRGTRVSVDLPVATPAMERAGQRGAKGRNRGGRE